MPWSDFGLTWQQSQPLLPSYAFAGLLFYLWYLHSVKYNNRLSFIPSVGASGLIAGYIEIYRPASIRRQIEEGYHKYRDSMFRFRHPFTGVWFVAVCGSNLINDMRSAREEDLSMTDANKEITHSEYTLGPIPFDYPYFIKVVQTEITKKGASRFDGMLEEIIHCFDENINFQDGESTSVRTYDIIGKVVFRAVNRFMLGTPICRDDEYVASTTRFFTKIGLSIFFLSSLPKFLQPIFGRLVSPLHGGTAEISKHIGPIIETRLQMDKEYGKDGYDRPDDLISWLVDGAPDEDARSYEVLIGLIVTLNFAAIDSTKQTLMFAMYHLATSPEYIQPLRAEIESVTKEEGFTASALPKMRKLDSFLRETLRFDLGAISMNRLVTNPAGFTFSNGATVPKGTLLTIPIQAVHLDEARYPNARVFDGFRFAESDSPQNKLSATSLDYLPFGHGKLACPGRFFVAMVLKSIMADIILTYDVSTESSVLPEMEWHGVHGCADSKEKIIFKKRKV